MSLKRVELKKNWLEILVVLAILLSAIIAFYTTTGMRGLEAELVGVAGGQAEVQAFLQAYPGSKPNLLKIAPKGIFSIKEGEMLDPHFERYLDDPLVGIIQEHEFDGAFPDVWIVVYSQNPVLREGYVAPHPPNPAAYIFFGVEKEVLFVEVLE